MASSSSVPGQEQVRMRETDLIIVGAGPAGLAAARIAADCGLAVLLLDEQRAAGGQIYRNVDGVSDAEAAILGKDYLSGRKLTGALAHPRIQHVRHAVVWQVTGDCRVSYSIDGVGTTATGRALLIATGAVERPMPIPGWTLPGVMTAGAAQILLKQSGIAAANAVLAGSGPLLYLVASQLCRAGLPPRALVETQGSRNLASAMRHGAGALRGWKYPLKGLGLLAELRRAGVERHAGARDLRVEGSDHAEALTFETRSGSKRIDCATVLLHHGVVPNTQITRSLEIEHRWDEGQSCFVPERDDWGRTSLERVFVAGDGGGIGGAEAAALKGRLSALAAACDLGYLEASAREEAARSIRRALAKEMAARPFIDAAYPPYRGALVPEDGTLICRCEEVDAAEIRRCASLGCEGPNQTKAYCRAGMGACQGRYCGLTVTNILSDELGRSPDEVGYYRIRAPLKPVTLGELAAMHEDKTEGIQA